MCNASCTVHRTLLSKDDCSHNTKASQRTRFFDASIIEYTAKKAEAKNVLRSMLFAHMPMATNTKMSNTALLAIKVTRTLSCLSSEKILRAGMI